MSMFKKFYPKKVVHSTYSIDFKKYYEKGYRGILFDIDNTLVPHGAPATKQAIEFFEKIKAMGYECCLISNNKLPRVKPFADAVGAKFIDDAHKPSRKAYQKAMELMGTDGANTLFVGDQLFTDVYGANRVGMYSILTRPIHPSEEIQIVFKRKLEKPVLKSYMKYRRKHKNRT